VALLSPVSHCNLLKLNNMREALKPIGIIVGMILLTLGLGSLINFLISLAFMTTFESIQLSAVWVLYLTAGFFYTIYLLVSEF
jgi:hypothetical protein